MKYRIALQGFTGVDRRELLACLDLPQARESGYAHDDALARADLVIANSDSQDVIFSLVRQGRVSTMVFIGAMAPAGALVHLRRPLDPAMLLRSLDELVARGRVPPGSIDRATASAEAPHDAPPGRSDATSEARSMAKAAARQAARRARLASMAQAPTSPSNILVLDEDDFAREHLCRLVEGFGFCAYPVTSVAQAAWMMQTRSFTAAFLDIAFDSAAAADAIGLCRFIKTMPAAGSGAACVLIVVCGAATPTDRVRAALAGGEVVLDKPVARGDVAGALEDCGVALPLDARRR